MINKDIEETKQAQTEIKPSALQEFLNFQKDLNEAMEELEELDNRKRTRENVTCFFFGIFLTVLVEAIGLLINKGIHG